MSITNCVFNTQPETVVALEKRADAVKELAIALGKAADALNIHASPGLVVNQTK